MGDQASAAACVTMRLTRAVVWLALLGATLSLASVPEDDDNIPVSPQMSWGAEVPADEFDREDLFLQEPENDDVRALQEPEEFLQMQHRHANPDKEFGYDEDPAFAAEGGHGAVNDPAFTPPGSPLDTLETGDPAFSVGLKHSHPCPKYDDCDPKKCPKGFKAEVVEKKGKNGAAPCCNKYKCMKEKPECPKTHHCSRPPRRCPKGTSIGLRKFKYKGLTCNGCATCVTAAGQAVKVGKCWRRHVKPQCDVLMCKGGEVELVKPAGHNGAEPCCPERKCAGDVKSPRVV